MKVSDLSLFHLHHVVKPGRKLNLKFFCLVCLTLGILPCCHVLLFGVTFVRQAVSLKTLPSGSSCPISVACCTCNVHHKC